MISTSLYSESCKCIGIILVLIKIYRNKLLGWLFSRFMCHIWYYVSFSFYVYYMNIELVQFFQAVFLQFTQPVKDYPIQLHFGLHKISSANILRLTPEVTQFLVVFSQPQIDKHHLLKGFTFFLHLVLIFVHRNTRFRKF